MEAVDWTSILAVIGTAVGFLGIGWKIANGFQEKMEKSLHEMRSEQKEELQVMWKRFDQRKTLVDQQIKAQAEAISRDFVSREIYEIYRKNSEEKYSQQIESIKALLDAKLQSVLEEIKNIRAK